MKTKIILIAGACLLMSACGLSAPRVVLQNSNSITMETIYQHRNKTYGIASQHCSRYGKQSVLKNINNSNIPFIYTFECE